MDQREGPDQGEGRDPRGGRLARAVDWAFRDRRTGRITVGQWPNPPLWLFLALGALSLVVPDPAAGWLRLAADAALAWWAGDEVLRGVNPWRRTLGGATLAGLALAFALG